jgi:hypothetical protein
MEDLSAVLDAPVDSTPEVVAAEETGNESTASPAPGTGPESQDDGQGKADRRRNPDALRKTLKWLRENGGEHSERAQEIERYLGENKSYKSVYPTVKEAREAKLAVDSVGGVAKIAELQHSAAHMAEVDSLLEAGDPKILDDIFKQAPQGMAKLAPAILDRLAQSNPQAYAKAVTPHALGFMDSQGLTEAIDSMVSLFNEGKAQDARGILNKIVNWYNNLSKANQATPAVDPEREAFEKERETFAQQKFSGEVTTLFNQVVSHAEQTLDKHLAADKKRLGLSTEAYQLLREDAWKYLQSARNEDGVFKSSLGNKINTKSRTIAGDALGFLNAQTDDKAQDACEKAVRLRYGHLKATSTTAIPVKKSPTSAPTGSLAVLDQAMTAKKLDSRDKAMDAILSGQGYSKDGKKLKKVQGKWQFA